MMPRDYTDMAAAFPGTSSALDEKVFLAREALSRLAEASPATTAGAATLNAASSTLTESNNMHGFLRDRANAALLESLIAREQLQRQQQIALLQSTQAPSWNSVGLEAADPFRNMLLQRSLQQQQLALAAASGPSLFAEGSAGLGLGFMQPGQSTLNTAGFFNRGAMADDALSHLWARQQLQQQSLQFSGGTGVALENAPTNEKRRGRTGTFPQKLHMMLSELEKQEGGTEIASFLPHGRSFVIYNPKEFVKSVMPKHFRMSRFSSFQRQLNLYEFQRVTDGNEKGSYYHELFIKGRPIRESILNISQSLFVVASFINDSSHCSPS